MMTPRRLARPGRLGTIGLALLGLLLAAMATHPLWLGPLVAWQLSGASGRRVAIESMWVGVTGDGRLAVHFRGVQVQNAAWADTARPFATLGAMVAIVSWRSLEERRPVIERLVLRDGEVDMERRADDVRNWRLRDPENRGPGVYKILALQAERTSLRFRHDGAELDFVATASAEPEPASGADAVPTRIDLKGHWRRLPFTARVATGPVLSFLETGSTFALRGFVEAGGARLEATGRAGDIFRAPVVDAGIALAGNSLVPFGAFLGPRHEGQTKKPFRVEGRLEVGPRTYALSAAQARIGATELTGDVAWAREQRPILRATVASAFADLADLRWLAGRAPVAAARERLPDDADPHRLLRGVDAALRIDVRRLRAAEAPWLRSIALAASLADGVVAVTELDAGVLQAGRATGRLGVDLRKRPAALEAELALRGLRLENLLAAQAEGQRATGLLQADVRLAASGESTPALRRSVSGSVQARLVGGSIPGLLDAEIGLQGGRVLRSWLAGSERVAIRCAAASVDVRQGVGQLRSLVLDTERTRTVGTGRFDVGAGTVDVVLTPQARQGGLFTLERSIHLHGALPKPARELVARVVPPASAGSGCPGD